MKKIGTVFALCIFLHSGAVSSAGIADLPLRDNISVGSVSGGDRTNPRWESGIGNVEFRRALENSLNTAGLLERAKGEGRYVLSAELESIDQPTIGVSLTITARVKYTLTDRLTGETVYQESIVGEYSTKVWDSLWRPKRLEVASKGAARDNTERLTERLTQPKLAQGQLSLAQ
jgi:hypothetical protein